MINPKLTKKQVECANKVLEWVNRMNEMYGPTVQDQKGVEYDWAQALCREVYGVDWVDYISENDIIGPTQDVLNRALKWEEGDVPSWVLYQDKPVEEYMKYTWNGINTIRKEDG